MNAPGFDPGFSLKVICAWCGDFMGLKTCSAAQHGQVSHGICPQCKEKVLRDRSAADQEPHKLPVAGSTPAPATTFDAAKVEIISDPQVMVERSADWVLTRSEHLLSLPPAARAAVPLHYRQELLARLNIHLRVTMRRKSALHYRQELLARLKRAKREIQTYLPKS